LMFNLPNSLLTFVIDKLLIIKDETSRTTQKIEVKCG